MNQEYYDATNKLEQMHVNDEYIVGWQGGYLHNTGREEQRVTDAYQAGYSDGENKSFDKAGKFVKK